jgi:hypothetical protein
MPSSQEISHIELCHVSFLIDKAGWGHVEELETRLVCERCGRPAVIRVGDRTLHLCSGLVDSLTDLFNCYREPVDGDVGRAKSWYGLTFCEHPCGSPDGPAVSLCWPVTMPA